MLEKLGCTFVTVGHSERREYNGETDEVVNAKVHAALRNNLTPIVCMGEGLEVRQAGRQVEHVLAQLDADLAGVSADQVAGLVIAYEPIWAIGTGDTCESSEANRVIGLIRGQLENKEVTIQYGGSVNANNIDEIMAQPEINGGLVGGASLEAQSFARIVQFQ